MYKKHENIGLKCKHVLRKRNNVLNFRVLYSTKLYTQKSTTIEKNITKLNLPLEELKASGKAFSMNKDDNISKRQT
jgi:hypothetical protein